VGQANKCAKNFKSRFYSSLLKLTARQLREFALPAKPSGQLSRLRARKESRWQAGMAQFLQSWRMEKV
jgi:hypothetical protein